MMGLAAGLAASGKVVFAYSIANFPTLRCLEQIRNDVCYHGANVKIVAVGGGLSYASLGYTHHGVEDLGVLRTLPNLVVLAPGDPVETRLATRAAAKHPGPCYMRLGKAGEPVVYAQTPVFEIGKANVLSQGHDVAILSTGGMLQTAAQAAAVLEARGVSVLLLSLHTVQPLDEEAVTDAAHRTGRLITIEEHGPGGLADAVAEVLLRRGVSTRFQPLRLGRQAVTVAGSQSGLLQGYGLSVEGVVDAVVSLF